jgi:hypothetical protein
MPSPKAKVTEIRHLVVDMAELNKNKETPDINDDDCDDESCEEIVVDPAPSRGVSRRSGGVLKGGGAYVRSGELRHPCPRVSFLLEGPAEKGDDGPVQFRVFAKPPQVRAWLVFFSFSLTLTLATLGGSSCDEDGCPL